MGNKDQPVMPQKTFELAKQTSRQELKSVKEWIKNFERQPQTNDTTSNEPNIQEKIQKKIQEKIKLYRQRQQSQQPNEPQDRTLQSQQHQVFQSHSNSNQQSEKHEEPEASANKLSSVTKKPIYTPPTYPKHNNHHFATKTQANEHIARHDLQQSSKNFNIVNNSATISHENDTSIGNQSVENKATNNNATTANNGGNSSNNDKDLCFSNLSEANLESYASENSNNNNDQHIPNDRRNPIFVNNKANSDFNDIFSKDNTAAKADSGHSNRCNQAIETGHVDIEVDRMVKNTEKEIHFNDKSSDDQNKLDSENEDNKMKDMNEHIEEDSKDNVNDVAILNTQLGKLQRNQGHSRTPNDRFKNNQRTASVSPSKDNNLLTNKTSQKPAKQFHINNKQNNKKNNTTNNSDDKHMYKHANNDTKKGSNVKISNNGSTELLCQNTAGLCLNKEGTHGNEEINDLKSEINQNQTCESDTDTLIINDNFDGNDPCTRNSINSNFDDETENNRHMNGELNYVDDCALASGVKFITNRNKNENNSNNNNNDSHVYAHKGSPLKTSKRKSPIGSKSRVPKGFDSVYGSTISGLSSASRSSSGEEVEKQCAMFISAFANKTFSK